MMDKRVGYFPWRQEKRNLRMHTWWIIDEHWKDLHRPTICATTAADSTGTYTGVQLWYSRIRSACPTWVAHWRARPAKGGRTQSVKSCQVLWSIQANICVLQSFRRVKFTFSWASPCVKWSRQKCSHNLSSIQVNKSSVHFCSRQVDKCVVKPSKHFMYTSPLVKRCRYVNQSNPAVKPYCEALSSSISGNSWSQIQEEGLRGKTFKEASNAEKFWSKVMWSWSSNVGKSFRSTHAVQSYGRVIRSNYVARHMVKPCHSGMQSSHVVKICCQIMWLNHANKLCGLDVWSNCLVQSYGQVMRSHLMAKSCGPVIWLSHAVKLCGQVTWVSNVGMSCSAYDILHHSKDLTLDRSLKEQVRWHFSASVQNLMSYSWTKSRAASHFWGYIDM